MNRKIETKDRGEDEPDVVELIDDLAAKMEGTLSALQRRQDELEKKFNRPVRPGGGGDLDTKAGDLAAEHKALGAFIKSGDETEFKALATDFDPAAGYFVLPQMSSTMTKRIYDQSPIRRLSRTISLEAGDVWEEPIDNDESGAQWVGERQERGATATPQLGMFRVPLCEIWGQQPVTQKLLDTSSVNVGAWIEGKLSDKFARVEGESFVNGDTPLEPQGFMTLAKSALGDMASRPGNALQFVNSGSATAITADGLRDLYWTLRAPHRANATWLMASATANALDKLKDGYGDYIWRSSSTAGVLPTLLGRPVEFDENMPTIAAGTFPVAFADWQKAYVIVDRLGLRLVRDPYTSKPNVLFDAFKRVGGGVANSDAIKLQQISA